MRAFAAALVALLVAGSAPADARPKKKRVSAQKKAQREKRRAFKLFKKGDYEQGIAAMESAYRLVPHPGFLLNVAVAYDQWGGHCKDSLVAFDRFFDACAGSCRMLGAAMARQEKVKAACNGELAILTTPAGAAVAIDGEAIGSSPLTAPLGVGKHYVAVGLEGHEPETREFEIVESKTTRIEIALTAKAAPPPPPPTKTAPPPPAPPPPAVVVPAPTTDDGVDPWPWISIGVGAAGVGVGVLFTMQTMSALDDEESARLARMPKTEVERLQDDATSKAIIANVGYAVGAVGLATGVVLLIVGGDDGDDGSVTFHASPNAVSIAGTF